MREQNVLKEVKAYIRPERIEDVVKGLEELGVCQMTIIDVQALGKGRDPKASKYSFEFLERYSKLAKLEIVCPHVRANHVLETIARLARTGQPGDGYVYVSDVESALDLYTGEPIMPTRNTK